MASPPQPDDRRQTLAGIDLLAGLGRAERVAVERRCRWRSFAAGEQIIDRETETQDVYFVVAGQVRVVNYALSGREVSFDDIAAGGYFGELAAIDGEPRSANVVATAETLTASLPGPAFIEAMAAHPSVALALMRRLSEVVRHSTGRIMDLSSLGAHNRIYAELLRMANAGVVAANRAAIRPIPPHADIAARVSTTRETVARVLNELARKRLVKREAGALLILDVSRLTDMVHQFHVD
ncbi:MAG: Crp/Fnr family transcriptional regulator [Rhodospirillales bacterium]|nr:Crp/Fnr family transcriptional regulator [Rhodospirillales bacterium]